MYCRKKEADPFKLWVVDILDKRRKERAELEDPIDQIIATSKMVTEMAERYKRLNHRQIEADFERKRLADQQYVLRSLLVSLGT